MNLTALNKGEVTSPATLDGCYNTLESVKPKAGQFLFRGQPRVYDTLQPFLTRSLITNEQGTALLLEKDLIDNFRSHYQDLRHLPPDMPTAAELNAYNNLEILCLMQHYEVPTRLLDWSANFWVAAYFACASDINHDGELWFMDTSLLDPSPETFSAQQAQQAIEESIAKKPGDYREGWGMPLLAAVRPRENSRLLAQDGWLTASDFAAKHHNDLLWHLASRRHGGDKCGWSFGKYVIKKERKKDILTFLGKYKSISAKTLFPDVPGLGRYVRAEFEALRTMLV